MVPNGLRALALALALLPALASAQSRSDGDFAATLVVTDRLDQPTPHAAVSALRGEVVWAVIVFSHCAPDPHGRCRAVADFTVLRPDGSTYATHPGVEVWSSMPPRRRSPQLSNARLGLQVERNDPLGRYRIRAVVKDLVAERSVTLERDLLVGSVK